MGGGEALPYKSIPDMPFFSRVSFFSLNFWNTYKHWQKIPKQAMTIGSTTISYCFHVFILLSENFCNLIIPKQFFLQFFSKHVVAILKGTSPSCYIQVPPPPGFKQCSSATVVRTIEVLQTWTKRHG